MIAPPTKIKLYYINQGICKRVTKMDLKYSDDIKVMIMVFRESSMPVFILF